MKKGCPGTERKSHERHLWPQFNPDSNMLPSIGYHWLWLPLLSMAILWWAFLRFWSRVDVSCWFCCRPLTVSRKESNSWDCPSCGQYNGFKEDGDYNKQMPAFYEESLNGDRFCRSPLAPGSQGVEEENKWDNGLCLSCNFNQQVKTKLLAEFVAFDEHNFEKECRDYEKELDKVYGICLKCVDHVDRVLASQRLKFNLTSVKHLPEKCPLKMNPVFAANKPEDWCRLRIAIQRTAQLFSVVSALLLTVLNLSALEQDTKMRIMPLPENLHLILSQGIPSRAAFAVLGLVSSIVSTLMTESDAFTLNDVMASLFWVSVQVMHLSVCEEKMPKPDLYLLRPILSGFTSLFCVTSVLIGENRRRAFKSIELNRQTLLPCNPKTPKTQTATTVPNESAPQKCVTQETEWKDGDDNGTKNWVRNEQEDKSILPISQRIDALRLCPETKSNPKGWEEASEIGSIISGRTSFSSDSSVTRGPVVKPAKFLYKSITETSWVGDFWSKKSSGFGSDCQAQPLPLFGFQQTSIWSGPGVMTPPPSASSSLSGSRCDATKKPVAFGNDAESDSLFIYSSPHLKRRSLNQKMSISDSFKEVDVRRLIARQQFVCTSCDNSLATSVLHSVRILVLSLLVFSVFSVVIFLTLSSTNNVCEFNDTHHQRHMTGDCSFSASFNKR